MNIANLYRKLKQILNDSNIALPNKGLSSVSNLYQIPDKLTKLGEINCLPYVLRREIIELSENYIGDIVKINDYAFYGCDSLTNVTIPDSVTSIGEYAFYHCHSLTSITIPGSVTSIGSSAFYGINGLESVIISDGVVSIGKYAFYGCKSLTNVTIPESVTSIGRFAFEYCESLTNIYINSTVPPSLGGTDTIPSHTTIHVPIGSGDTYKSATNWSSYADRIVEDMVV